MYQALYRKYRPIDFDSVVGQDAIVKTLKNSIKNSSFSHAYMFFGSRGTGKTTVSKIFARNVNCLDSKDGLACGKCDSCKASFSKDCIDIIEIDAASNNGVEEIRELKNKISLVPSELKYKVYIIDEVHMLSSGAFNALLKTLEEPPEHAIFILATTDPQKVPETIVSRCQCFSFKRIPVNVIYERLKFVCEKEKIKIEDEVLTSISILSEGGMRDALGMLDKLRAYSDDKILMKDFIEINGIISDSDLEKFISNAMTGNVVDVLSDINLFDNSGKNLIQIFIQVLNYSRKMLVDYYLSNKKLSFSIDDLLNFTNIINEKMFDIKKSGNTRIYLETIVLKFMNDFILKENKQIISVSREEKAIDQDDENKVVENKNSITKLQENEDYDFSREFGDDDNDDESDVIISDFRDVDKSLEDGSENIKVLNIDKVMEARVHNTLALANKELLKEEIKLFELLKDYTFDQEIGYLVCSLLDSKVRAVSNDSVILSYEYDSNVKQNLNLLDKITEVYQKITKSEKNIAIVSDDEWDRVKNEYIFNLKNKVKYEVVEEPELLFEETKKDDIINGNAIELFGDIVEIE